MESIAAQRRFCIIVLVLALGGVPVQIQAQAISLDPAKMLSAYRPRCFQLNGNTLRLTSSGDLPQLNGKSVNAGHVIFAPTSITYLIIANAGNANCQ
jgi:hypothetical protein